MTSQSTTSTDVQLDYTDTMTCEFCNAELPRQLIPINFGDFGLMPIGYVQCDCDGAKHARRDEAERHRMAIEERKRAERVAALNRAGIPKRYHDAEHPYADKMARMAKDGQGFYIFGPNGTYKTTLAMAAGRILLDAGADVFAITTYDLMDAMRSRKDEDRELFERAATCEVLILDDIGKEATNTAYACERLFAIIDKRDKEMLPTIATSNFKLSEIARKITEGAIGVAIASRLASSCKEVPLEGKDRRIFHE